MERAVLIIDLGYGDAGKGTIVDYLSTLEPNTLIVRYNGGPQAAHNVVTPRFTHTFSQFGSGMFVPGVKTYLSKYTMVNPINFMNEYKGLCKLGVEDAIRRMFIDQDAPLITPFHKAVNRIKEMARGTGRHGSCGEGISEAFQDIEDKLAIFVKDLYNDGVLKDKLCSAQERAKTSIQPLIASIPSSPELNEEINIVNNPLSVSLITNVFMDFAWSDWTFCEDAEWETLVSRSKQLVFEGAQGILLDQKYGFFPYVTRNDITLNNAYRLLQDYTGEIIPIGVMRVYSHRHGPGPFVSENTDMKVQPGEHNHFNKWQGDFRVGNLDMVTAQYAVEVIGELKGLAVTCLDQLGSIPKPVSVCDSYAFCGSRDEARKYGLLDEADLLYLLNPLWVDRNYQLNRTDFIMQCKPELAAICDGEYLAMIEDYLQIPVSIVSKGPMAKDKYIRGLLK
jgi:adenylosuccinate synthase